SNSSFSKVFSLKFKVFLVMPATLELPKTTKLAPVPNFIGGEWQNVNLIATSSVFNSSPGDVFSAAPMCGAKEVNDAVEAAAAAFPAWWETPPTERARVMFRFKALLEENFEDIVRCNTREHGKTLVESRGDVRRGIEMVEFSCGIPSL